MKTVVFVCVCVLIEQICIFLIEVEVTLSAALNDINEWHMYI